MQSSKISQLLKFFILGCILALTSFTHLFRINHTYIFHNDEARDALIVRKMWDSRTPVFLGPQTSIGNMYLGPIYYYFMTPALILSNFDPVGPAIMVAIFGIATTFLLYLYTSRKYGMTAGVIAAIFYSLSPVMLHYSRSSWNPNLVPFFAILLLFTVDSKSYRSWFLFGLISGIIFQLHYVALIIVALVGIKKLLQSRSYLGLCFSLLGFFITSSPFWLFELRHQWVNLRAFFTFLSSPTLPTGEFPSYFHRIIANFNLFCQGIIGSSTLSVIKLNSILTSSIVILVVLGIFQKKNRALTFYIIGSTLIVSILKTPLNVHYLAHLFPLACILIGSLVGNHNRFLSVSSLTFCLYTFIFFLPTLKYNLFEIDSSQSIRARTLANYIYTQAGGKPYNIVSTAGTYSTPVEYYLSLTNNRPQTFLTELIFNICDDKPCPTGDLTNTNLFATGPTHPAIIEYLGRPQLLSFTDPLQQGSNVSVSYGTYVATYYREP